MAKQDACVAIDNVLQKMGEQSNLVHQHQKLKSVKSELQSLGSILDEFEFDSSKEKITELSQVREIANRVEDALDDVAAVNTEQAQKRWRKLGNLVSGLSGFGVLGGAHSQGQRIDQHLSNQIVDIKEKRQRLKNIDSISGKAPVNTDTDSTSSQLNNVKSDFGPLVNLLCLFLSAFPANTELPVRQLIQVWAAHGWMDDDSKESVMQEILRKGLIIPGQNGTAGTLKTCKIAGDGMESYRKEAKEHNILQVWTHTDDETTSPPQIPMSRLVVRAQSSSRLPEILRRLSGCWEIRSLQIQCLSSNNNLHYESSKGLLKAHQKALTYLWVLDLGSFVLESVPDVIGKLKHLRYLRLRAPNATRIPFSIGNMNNLQTLDMKETEHLKTFPVNIWRKKSSLQHIHIGGAAILPRPRWADRYNALEKLQTLSGVCPNKWFKWLIIRAKFPNLGRLRLNNNNSESNNEELIGGILNSLDHLYHLRSLTLSGASKLPSDWNAFPLSLTKITLVETGMQAEDCMKTLANIANLRVLKLLKASVLGSVIECKAGWFSALQVLRIEQLVTLEDWKLEKGAMGCLEELVVRDCEGLQKFEVRTITSLKRVSVVKPSSMWRAQLQQLPRTMSVKIDPPF